MIHRFHSLASRFILASLLLLPLFLGVSGYTLEKSFQRSQQAAIQEQLKSYIYLLMGAAELDNGQLWMPEQLTEPRFNSLNSGLMATISNRTGVLWQSPSSALEQVNNDLGEPLRIGNQRFAQIQTNSEPWYRYSHDVSWQQPSGDDQLLRFTVLHNQLATQAQLASYRQQLWQWLIGLGSLLLVTQLLIMRWGLKPLHKVAADLRQIEQGNKQQLQDHYPAEITPVTNNLNRVLNSERQQRERYRNTMADLAHSLKTPLAVMRSQAQMNSGSNSKELDEQLSRMDQIIEHQLQRAIRGNEAIDSTIVLLPVTEQLIRTLGKIYQHKNIHFDNHISSDAVFKGDQSDLMEILGNLLENACKYGAGQVRLTGKNTVTKNQGSQLHITVEDNGPGVPPEQQALILQRGARADTVQSGQGIGLAVVVDIVSSYNGELRIGQSEMGGAKFCLSLN